MDHLNRHQRRAMKHALARSDYTTLTNGIAHSALTDGAYDALHQHLRANGNVLNSEHEAALYALCGLFTESAQGKQPGRWAFSLPTGMGKTSAIVAWCSTLARLGLDHISVAVSASKVEALVELKKAMMTRGVPEERIGLLYALNGTRQQLPPTDANDDRQIMLVAHNRVRMRDGHERFMTYKGKARSLLIWDEGLLASDAYGVSVCRLRSAIAYLAELWRDRSGNEPALLGWLCAARDRIEGALASADAQSPATITLPELDDASLEELRCALPREPVMAPIADVLAFCREELRVLPTSERGVVWYQMAVPREIHNIIVLDASYPIRELVKADTTIRDAEEHLAPIKRIGKRLSQLKRYDNVVIHQLFSGGGRDTMQRDLEEKTGRRAVREVVDVVKGIPPDEAVLVFTFKDRLGIGSGVNYRAALLRALDAAGIDPHAQVDAIVDGKATTLDRINIATWGQETSLNRWAHCSNVILCGVLQRSSLDLASSFIGQTDDLKAEVSAGTVKALARSEVAHVVYQALSRGSCRVMDNGQAKSMRGWLIHRDVGVQPLLSTVMPGVRWAEWTAKHMANPDGRQPGVIASTVAKIVRHLRSLPPQTGRLSTRRLKADAGLTHIHPNTFTEALRAAQGHVGWTMHGRSVVRSPA